jgi:truncated hemoglobin YjbI
MEPPPRLCQQITRDTVAEVVHRFYRRVLDEPTLAGYFSHIDNWPQHESHITDFWWGVMGGKVETPRPRAMELGHRDLDFGQQELMLWLALFEHTLRESLPEECARQWFELARGLGKAMSKRGMVRQD